MVLARGFKYQWIRAAGDEAVRIDRIPCGNEDVDLVSMGQERTHGLGIARQVEKGLGLFRPHGETKKDDRGYGEQFAFHSARSLAALPHETQRRCVRWLALFPEGNDLRVCTSSAAPGQGHHTDTTIEPKARAGRKRCCGCRHSRQSRLD